MNDIYKSLKEFLQEHKSEIFVGLIFLSFAIAFYVYRDCVFAKDDIKDFIMPLVVLVGFFLAWLQFLFISKLELGNEKKRLWGNR